MAQSPTVSERTAIEMPTTRHWWALVLRVYIAIAVPILLVLGSVRLVMTPTFLAVEYNRQGFPTDPYGFTTQDRLTFAPHALNYLLNTEGIAYLGDLTFTDGTPLYNARELQHMVDVKRVSQVAFGVALAGFIVALAAAYILWRNPATRLDLARGLASGSLITIGLIAGIVVLSVLSWDVFFTGFHQMFFSEGSWRFLYSDTLIRLFPEQFWFDAALVIGGLTLIGALILLVLGRYIGKRPTS